MIKVAAKETGPVWECGLGKFLSGYPPSLGSNSFPTLEEAQAACVQCEGGGVTQCGSVFEVSDTHMHLADAQLPCMCRTSDTHLIHVWYASDAHLTSDMHLTCICCVCGMIICGAEYALIDFQIYLYTPLLPCRIHLSTQCDKAP